MVRKNIETRKWAFDFGKRKLIIELCDKCDCFEKAADDFAQENTKLKNRQLGGNMKYINIEQVEEGKVKAKADINGKEFEAEFSDMVMAAVWAEELAEWEAKDGGEDL